MRLSIPDIGERAILARKHEKAIREGTKIRRIRHKCGHEQGHDIDDGCMARDEYRSIAAQPCGARGGEFGSIENRITADDEEEAAERGEVTL
jgi:hypothetical protein